MSMTVLLTQAFEPTLALGLTNVALELLLRTAIPTTLEDAVVLADVGLGPRIQTLLRKLTITNTLGKTTILTLLQAEPFEALMTLRAQLAPPPQIALILGVITLVAGLVVIPLVAETTENLFPTYRLPPVMLP